jgi:hypothetical protein
MKKSYIITLALLTYPYVSSAQEDSVRYAVDSVANDESNPQRSYISGIIKEVNNRSELIDNIHSEGELTVKTATIDNSGSIEIKAKKKDDVWFKIEGPLGIDIAEGHFGRKRFTFLDSRNDKAVEGSTNITNIGALTKIRCSFDDLMNAFTGTVRIVKSKSDSLSISEEGSQYVIWAKRGTIVRRYWVDKNTYSVTKYAYFDKNGITLFQVEFSNFSTYSDASYAKRIEVRRPKQGEYFKLELESVSLNVSNLSFYVSIPSGTRRINWK